MKCYDVAELKPAEIKGKYAILYETNKDEVFNLLAETINKLNEHGWECLGITSNGNKMYALVEHI